MKAFFFVSVILLSGVGCASKQPRVVDSAATATPTGEVCFSPDEPCDEKLWKFIQSAQKSLDIAVFDLTHEKITHEILMASRRIPVRILVDAGRSKMNYSTVSTLIKAGTNVRYGKQRSYMHHKFTLVDGKRLETGSFNYTRNAYLRNQENQLYLDDPAIVQRYVDQFEKMWRDGNEVASAARRAASQ